jgi:hypothetical protein
VDLVDDVERLLNRELIKELPLRPGQLMSKPLFYDGPGRQLPCFVAKAIPFHVPYEIINEGYENSERR